MSRNVVLMLALVLLATTLGCGSNPPSAEIIEAKLRPLTESQSEASRREVVVRLRNTGKIQIRSVQGMINVFDVDGNLKDGFEYALYQAGDAEDGIAPGEEFETPPGQGFFLEASLNPGSVQAEIIEVQ